VPLGLLDRRGKLCQGVLEAPRLRRERTGRDREVRDQVAELSVDARELLEDAAAGLEQAAEIAGLLAEQGLADLRGALARLGPVVEALVERLGAGEPLDLG